MGTEEKRSPSISETTFSWSAVRLNGKAGKEPIPQGRIRRAAGTPGDSQGARAAQDSHLEVE